MLDVHDLIAVLRCKRRLDPLSQTTGEPCPVLGVQRRHRPLRSKPRVPAAFTGPDVAHARNPGAIHQGRLDRTALASQHRTQPVPIPRFRPGLGPGGVDLEEGIQRWGFEQPCLTSRRTSSNASVGPSARTSRSRGARRSGWNRTSFPVIRRWMTSTCFPSGITQSRSAERRPDPDIPSRWVSGPKHRRVLDRQPRKAMPGGPTRNIPARHLDLGQFWHGHSGRTPGVRVSDEGVGGPAP